MNKFIGGAIMIASLVVFSPVSNAQDFKPYVGGGVGGFLVDTSQIPGGSSQTVFGGYGAIGVDYGDFLGFELRGGATNSSSLTVTGVNMNVGLDYFFSYLGKIQYPVTKDFRVYALLGGTTAKATATITTPGFVFVSTGTTQASDTTTGFSVGVGADFEILNQWRIGGEWVRYYSDVDGFVGTIKYLF